MQMISVIPLTKEAFAPFGTYESMVLPNGYALKGEIHAFYPDRVIGEANGMLGFSPIVVEQPKKRIITQLEYHLTTWEMILPLNDDMIIHVAPASAGIPVTVLTKAFLVPKGTLVKIAPAIWHLAPLPVSQKALQAMIVLPICTYMKDCTVVDLSPEDQFEIVLET